MQKKTDSICVVSPFPPPLGGMAIQAEKLVALLKDNGFEVIPVRTNASFPGSLNWVTKVKGIRTLFSIFLFLRHLHRTLPKVDMVYFLTGFFNFFFWVTYPALILIKLHRKKVVLSARGGSAGDFFRKYGLLLKPLLKTVDVITTPSGFLQDAFVKAFDIRPVIIPNIIDLEQFRFRERLPIRPKFLATRSLEKIYNVGCVIKAFKKIYDYFPDALLGIAGDGTERQKLKKMISHFGLDNSVIFYGRVDHNKIQDLYAQYDIFLNASNVDNLPGTILEAFASGLPVVSTNAGGIPYMVEDGLTGLLVEKNACEALAEKAIKLLKSPELASQLAHNARRECQKYSRENVMRLLSPIIDDIVSV